MNRELQSNNIKWEKKTADGLKNKIMNDGWLMHVSSLEMISCVSIYNLVKEAKTPTAIRIIIIRAISLSKHETNNNKVKLRRWKKTAIT